MTLFIALLAGVFAGLITNYFLALLGLPSPLPMIGGVVVFLTVVFSRDRILA